MSHQAQRSDWACCSSSPQLGVGGGRPKPRKSRMASEPIAPIAGTYQREPRSELAEFRCLSGALGWPGVSYWSFQHTNAGQWPVLGRPLTNCSIPAQARTYPTLRIRSRGDAVVRIQARLRAWGVPIPRTGFFLRRTRSGVRAFQRSRGLEADGVVGPLTWAALLEEPPISG